MARLGQTGSQGHEAEGDADGSAAVLAGVGCIASRLHLTGVGGLLLCELPVPDASRGRPAVIVVVGVQRAAVAAARAATAQAAAAAAASCHPTRRRELRRVLGGKGVGQRDLAVVGLDVVALGYRTADNFV